MSASEQPIEFPEGDLSLRTSQTGHALPAKPRKRRVKSVQSPPEAEVLGNAPVDPSVPVRRRRRKTATQAEGTYMMNVATKGSSCLRLAEAEAPPPSTPLAAEILENLSRYPHCILLTRVGQFYEVGCS